MPTTILDKVIINSGEETTDKPILVWNPNTRRVAWQTSPNPRIAALEAKLDSDNNFKFIPDPAYSYNAGTRVLTMNAGWEGTINELDYTNENAVVLPAIPLTTSGFTRIDLVAFTTDNTFIRVPGTQTTFNAIAPQLPPNSLQATFLTVTNASITIKNPPVPYFGYKASQTISGTVKTDVTVVDPVVYVKETVDNLLDAKANFFLDIKNITGITYNVIIDDILFQLVYAGTLPMNVIIPNNSAVPFPIGTIFYTLGTNTGILTASGASGVTLNVKAGISLSAIQNEVRQYTKIGVNTWSVRGDLNLGAVTQTELSYLQGLTSNIQAQLNAKTALTGGVANRLMMWLSATTATVSRIWDTGTFLGIGTVNTPSKHLTFGNQANREIGIEESNIYNEGRSLEIRAGRAINFILGSNLIKLDFPSTKVNIASDSNDVVVFVIGSTMYKKAPNQYVWTESNINVNAGSSARIQISSNNDYYLWNTNKIWKQINGIGDFVEQTLPASQNGIYQLCITPSQDVYYCTSSNISGDNKIFKRTNGNSTFTDLNQTARNWSAIAFVNGDVYAGILGGSIYKQTNATGNFILYHSGVPGTIDKIFNFGTDIYVVSETGTILKQTNSTGSFVALTNLPVGKYYSDGVANSDGNFFFSLNDGVYQLSPSNTGTPNLNGGTLKQVAGTGKGTGQSRWEVYTGQKQASGTDMQPETLREYIDENGYHVYTSMPVHADNAAAITAGLPVGCKYRNATGDLKIVY